MVQWMMHPESWMALLTLTALEIILGLDNIVFLTLLVHKVPAHQQALARRLGLFLAMLTRIGLLMSIAWLAHLTAPLMQIFSQSFSGRDLILIGGGLFLMLKATNEIHQSLKPEQKVAPNVPSPAAVRPPGLGWILCQIAVIDLVFSLDSVITAVGMANDIPVMVLAIVLSMGIMLWAARPIGDFVHTHPTIKMLALSFLLLIGVALLADGCQLHIPRGYIYFSMAFSVVVELLNIRLRPRV